VVCDVRQPEGWQRAVTTTNWDAVLEPAFAAADEPFDLFVYNHDGPHAGKFLHRSPDGTESRHQTPRGLYARTLSGSVLIKMNGGIDAESRWPGRFAVTTRDFEQLSVRMPEVFPRVLWDLMRPRSFLFWGHGLAEPDVRALMPCTNYFPHRRGPCGSHRVCQTLSIGRTWQVLRL
jgi:hypothetical protein